MADYAEVMLPLPRSPTPAPRSSCPGVPGNPPIHSDKLIDILSLHEASCTVYLITFAVSMAQCGTRHICNRSYARAPPEIAIGLRLEGRAGSLTALTLGEIAPLLVRHTMKEPVLARYPKSDIGFSN